MNEEKKEGFEYSYSAPTAGERREIEGIRSKYMPADERQQKLERLKALDRKVKRPAVLLAAAAPLYRLVYGRRKKKYAEEILRLSAELLNE